MREIEVLRRWVEEGERIVFFGGAGVSTESGIPDFRGVDGLYRTEAPLQEEPGGEGAEPAARNPRPVKRRAGDIRKFAYPPEEILSAGFFRNNPEVFFQFYREKVLFPDALPNAAHKKLVEWERAGKLLAIITQNIDGLHQRAGSRRVLELHGSVHRNHCASCGKEHRLEAMLDSADVPRCDCGGIIRPDVVLYGESLDCEVLGEAATAIASADLLIVGGTSLVVYPAAGLINFYRGKRLAIVNREGLSARANLTVRGAIGEVFSSL